MIEQWLEDQRINGGPHGFECVGIERLRQMEKAISDHEKSQCAKWLAATAPYLRDAFVIEFMTPNATLTRGAQVVDEGDAGSPSR